MHENYLCVRVPNVPGVLGPDRFSTVPMPSYAEIRIAVAPGIRSPIRRLSDIGL